MAVGELKIDVRRKKIIDILQRDGQVRVTQLSEELGTTVVTIRSDLDALEQDGYLERVNGGAVQTTFNYYNREFLRKKMENAAAKKKVAAAAADLIKDGDTIFLNSGTTTYFLATELKKYRGLKIVTNSLMAAVELGSYPTFQVILLGGEINSEDSFTYGQAAVAQIRKFKANYTILSINGINEDAVTTLHADEALVDEMMMEQSNHTIVVADKSKVGAQGFLQMCTPERITTLVTEKSAEPDIVQALTEQGVHVILA